MGGERREVTFQQLIDEGLLEIGDGYRAQNNELGGSGPIFLRAGHVTDSHIDFDGVEHFHEHLADKVRSKMSKIGDTIITTKGNSTGRTSFVTDRLLPFVYSPHLSYWRSRAPEKLFSGFLRYWSQGVEFIEQLSAMKVSTDMAPYLSLTDQRRLSITLPPLSEQKAIAGVLGALDDKIELNRRMNGTLEAMARALFQSWFVDFDPVRAKLDGRPLTGMDKETATLFPDSFQISELGQIPKGWEVRTADEISVVGIGKTPPRVQHHWFSENPTDLPWMSIRDLGDAGVFISKTSEFLTPEAVEKFRVRRIPDDTVVLSFKLTMGRVAITQGEMLSNEAIAHFRLNPETPIGSAYLFCYLKGFGYDQLGSTSSIATAINSDMVRGIKILLPSKGAAATFEATVAPLFAQIKTIQKQSRTLINLRDALLPKMLSGEVSVPKANIEKESRR
jgi:type I restriction enzyme S subunit